MKTATFVKKLDWRGDARLYRLSEPMEYIGSYRGEGDGKTEYVVVYAVMAFGDGPETYIFPAREDGVAINYVELDGSFREGLDHREALSRAGYEVTQ